MVIWDEGPYDSAEINYTAKKCKIKTCLTKLHSVKIKIVMHRQKLRGKFALISSFGKGENAWLLIKLKGRYPSPLDITDKTTKSTQKRNF